MLEFFRSRQWALTRRMLLVAIALTVGYRTYGNTIASWFVGPDAKHDIVITKSEFRPDLPGAKPAWIVGFKNSSRRFTYNQIQVEATYTNDNGDVLQTDKLSFPQKLAPGDEQIVGSIDFKERPGATRGLLKVASAEVVK